MPSNFLRLHRSVCSYLWELDHGRPVFVCCMAHPNCFPGQRPQRSGAVIATKQYTPTPLPHSGILLLCPCRAVDAGGNGTISATELFQLFEKIGHPIT